MCVREKEGGEEREIKFKTCIANTTPTKSAHRKTDSPLLDSDTSLVGEIGSSKPIKPVQYRHYVKAGTIFSGT